MARVRRLVSLCCVALLVAGCSGTDSRSGEPVPPFHPGTVSTRAQPDKPAGSFTVVATGDVLIHPALTEQAEADGGGKRDYEPLLAGIKPVISQADLAICHMETPIATADGPFAGYPLFYAPPEIAVAVADTGYDSCSTASNHTLDHGAEGVRTTLDALDAAKIAHTGSARTEQEAGTPLVRDVNGVKVAQVSFTFGLNQGTSAPEPWMVNELSVDGVLDAARKARAAGAEVVIASIHWGIENQHEPTAEQREMAGQILADPAVDLIVGHHAHVVQPFEKIGNKWVAYGLGNSVAKHEQPRGDTEEGVIARFRFTRDGSGWHVDKAEYIPTLVDLGPPIRLRDLTTDTSVDAARKKEALDRTDGVVLSEGAGAAGLTRPGGS
ncbi:CapA family protein [Actinophytocola sp.]|uniref:CapA family protein n=1 Tax=Actinophytocola sp. TaxID=1872138 RepID=UPI002D3A50EA|nr:CapA family protein [Actinophytocola sp.]HYQ65068.1 CapA family protein [Actinophytocola sp.]